jgi:hypothetical protein
VERKPSIKAGKVEDKAMTKSAHKTIHPRTSVSDTSLRSTVPKMDSEAKHRVEMEEIRIAKQGKYTM